jgi:tetratricopeptide (TPR) repeat protein
MKHVLNKYSRTPKAVCVSAVCMAFVFVSTVAYAQHEQQAEPTKIQWQATDTAGGSVCVPTAGKASVILFVKADQDRSRQALAQLSELLADLSYQGIVQGVAVVSGQEAGVGAAQLAGSDQWTGPIVIDTDYEASGLMSARVWPTTEVIDEYGNRIAHLPGLRESYAKDLRAYLDFVKGDIDRAALDDRLKTNDTIASTPDSIVSRHLHMAERLLEKGQTDLARKELEQGLAVDPDDIQLIFTLARIRVMTQDPAGALTLLDELTAEDAPAWRVQTLRGRALVELQRFDEARQALDLALEINPDPAEAYYYLGRVYEHDEEWRLASTAYRNAYEKAPSAK